MFEAKYVKTGLVRFVYADYPLDGHPNAVPAAEAARCAGEQGAFWQMHDALFSNQRQWSPLADPRGQFATYAQQLGLDTRAFGACLGGGAQRAAVERSRAAGDALRLPGTPSFAVNGTLIDTSGVTTIDQLVALMAQAVDAALAGQ